MFAVKSHSAVAAAALVLAVSLGLKIALWRPAATSFDDLRQQNVILGEFLEAQSVKNLVPFRITRVVNGWSFEASSCRSMASAMDPGGDLGQIAAGLRDGSRRLTYIYRGQQVERPPVFRMLLEQARLSALWPIRPSAFRHPFLVLLVESGNCRAASFLPWGQLWS